MAYKKLFFQRFIELSIVLAFIIILVGKILFSLSPIGVLYAYGSLVTLIVSGTFFIVFTYYKDPYISALDILKNKKDSKNIFVSCMVAVHNEEKEIHRCIDSLISQTYTNIEIIVVNDASTDNTMSVLQKYANTDKIILLDLKKNIGKKRALGQAMRIAKGSIFAFTDSDSQWAPDVIEKAVKIFDAHPNVGAVSGHSRAYNGDKNILTKIQDSWYEGQYSIRKAFESVFGAVTCVSGPLALFRREAIYNFIPAWENDTFLGQEFKFATDRTLTGFVLGSKTIGKKLKKRYKNSTFVRGVDYPCRNWFIVYSKSLRSHTIVPDTMKSFLKQQIRWKKSFIRNIFFTGRFYWQRPFPAALVYYAHIVFVFAGPFIVLRHLIQPLEGNFIALIAYISGITFVGFMFGIAYKLENRHCNKWMYRPLMSLMSSLLVSWLIFYSAATIRKMIWTRG